MIRLDFFTPKNVRNNKGFLTFSRDIEAEH